MHYLVYKTTNRANNKIYVGTHITQDINDGYLGSGLVLKRAIVKYGESSFSKEVLYDCSCEEEMYKTERAIVNEEFIARPDTYNIMLGGGGGFSYVNENKFNIYVGHGDMAKKNLSMGSEKVKELRDDKEWMSFWKQKISNSLKLKYTVCPHPWLGKKHSEETKKKIGEKNKISLMGNRNPSYGKSWIYNDSERRTIRVPKEELALYLNKGWTKGRKMNYDN